MVLWYSFFNGSLLFKDMDRLIAHGHWVTRRILLLGSNPVLEQLGLGVDNLPVGEQMRKLDGPVQAVGVEEDGVEPCGNSQQKFSSGLC